MIDQEKRKAIYQLHLEGMSARKISRSLWVSRNAVCEIIEQKGGMPDSIRKDKICIDEELLRRLYKECDGYKQRVQEKLQEEQDIPVKYSQAVAQSQFSDSN